MIPRTQQLRQQRHRLGGSEHVDRHRPRAVHRDQAAQVVPRRHDHPARRRPRQQRPHLVGRGGVVQHQQHPPARHQRAQHRALLVRVRRDLVRRHPERPQEPRQQVHLVRGRSQRVSAQVDVQLPVREPVAQQVRHVHGQRRLAHSRRPGQRHDRHRPARDQPRDPLHVPRPPGEVREVVRQPHRRRRRAFRLPRDHRSGQRRRPHQDRLVQRPQLSGRVDAQLLVQGPVELPERLQRLRLPAAAVQREHQLPPEPLAQRVVPRQREQLRHQVRVVAQRELHVDPLLVHGHQQLGQPWRVLGVERLRRHVRQHRPAPQLQRLGKRFPGRDQVVRRRSRPSASSRVREPVHVHGQRVDPHSVAVGGGLDQRRITQRCPQPHHVRLQRPTRTGRRCVTPHVLDQFRHGNDAVRPQQQRRQQRPVLARAQHHRRVAQAHIQRAEQPELRTRSHCLPFARTG